MGGGHSKALTYVVGFSSLTILGTLACYFSLSTNTLACVLYAACVSSCAVCLACALCTLVCALSGTLSSSFSYFNFWVSPAVSRFIYLCLCICSIAFPRASTHTAGVPLINHDTTTAFSYVHTAGGGSQ